MLKTIYKEILNISGRQEILMPPGSHVVAMKEQSGRPCIWYEVSLDDNGEPQRPYEIQTFLIFGTGHMIDAPDPADQLEWKYIDTTVMASGLVWHLYQELESEWIRNAQEYDDDVPLELPDETQERAEPPSVTFEELGHKCNFCEKPAIGIYSEKVSIVDGNEWEPGANRYMCEYHRKFNSFITQENHES